MLKYMRNNLKIIMWIIIGTFLGTIFVSWGMGGAQQQQNAAAKINGKKIPLTEYYGILNRYYNFYQKVYKENFSPEVLKKMNLEKMAMDQVIRDTLVGKKAEEMGIIASDEEIINYFKSYDDFKTDGKFDPGKFSQVNKVKGVDWNQQEKQIRKEITRIKIESIIKDGVVVSDKEIEFRYLFENKGKQIGLEKFVQAKDELRNRVLQEKKYKHLENWYEDMRKKSNIIVYNLN
ncbi:MAG: SurA N-terminal domain-containing protein [bacterium]